MPSISVSSAITSVSSTDPLLQWINTNATSEAQAIDYLEANLSAPPYNVPSEFLFDDIAVYLAASTNTQVNPNATSSSTSGTTNTSSGMSLSTMLGIPTAIGGMASMAGMLGMKKMGLTLKQTLQSFGQLALTSGLAAYLQLKVFTSAEQAAKDANTGNIAKAFGWGMGAIGATILWLASLTKVLNNAYWNTSGNSIFSKLIVLLAPHGQFGLDPHRIWYTLAVATAITGAVATAGAIVGANGSSGAPISPTGAAVQSMLSQIPDFTQLLPKSSIMFMTAGLTLGSMSYSVTPTNLFQQFSVPTVTLASSLEQPPDKP